MSDKMRIPVWLSHPGERKIAQGRKIELRYIDPATGKEVRKSTGTLVEAEALDQKVILEAQLLLGVNPAPRKKQPAGPNMPWEEFRDKYTKLQLNGLREKAVKSVDSRLDIAERIMKPKTLSDMASPEALHELQAKLIAGEESRSGKRSQHTVKSYMTTILTPLKWAYDPMKWLPFEPSVRKVKVSKLRQMKGRPICGEEFDKVLAKVKEVVGMEAESSWKYLLRGLWESGLRIEELMSMHWSDESFIVPKWRKGALPEIMIPAAMQKNDTEESIPLLLWFENLLLETPKTQRFGFCFNPMSLHVQFGRRVKKQRAEAEWIAKIVSRIGEKSGVVVRAKASGNEVKFVSSHDLRRSCGNRLALAGVPEREIAKVLRHADVETTRRFYAPGTVQESAGIIRAKLTVPGNSETAGST